MIGLDTNVLVRYLMQDEPEQSERATQLIDNLTEESQGFISTTVLVELCWVLERAYKVSRESLIATLDLLLRARELLVQDSAVAHRALRRFQASTCGFSDCLIVEQAREYGCGSIMTFDKGATTAGMALL
ncbi:hypothetical protein BJP27_24230 (plasmid) [Pseudomonas oryzihabitans]|nr:hypothetical protein BJP27_24230 [Pseudomonas psychrotolerans]